VLEPLRAEHNLRDYAAWSSSIDHIHATPGFAERTWPHAMSSDENLRDLEAHERDFEAGAGFTYTVLDPSTDEVIGCVYVYPSEAGTHDAAVRSWVRAACAHLDVPLWQAVSRWLATEWPFAAVEYAPREGLRS